MLGLEVADIVTEARAIRKLHGTGRSEEEIVRAVEQFDDALAIIRDSESSVILLSGMLAKNQSGEMADVQAAIRLERTNDGEHYMASLYALDNYQKIEAFMRRGFLIYSKYTKEDLEANNGAPELSPDLMRLLTSLGLSRGNVTTEKDLVKGENAGSVVFLLLGVRDFGGDAHGDGFCLRGDTFLKSVLFNELFCAVRLC